MNRISLLGALAFVITPGFAHTVRVDFDHAIHFSSYKTYRWICPPQDQSPEAIFPNQLMDQRVAGYIEEALAYRGLKRVTSGGDLLISYRMIISEQPQYITFTDAVGPGWNGGWGWGWAGASPWVDSYSVTTVQPFYQGTLVIDIVDAKRDELVFQGTSTQAVSSKPYKNTEKLAKAVNLVLAKYPPQH